MTRLGKLGNIELFHLLPSPQSSAQKPETGFYRGIAFKAVDLDSFSQVGKTIAVHQLSDHRFKGEAMQWIIRLLMFRLRIFGHSDELLSSGALTLGKVGANIVSNLLHFNSKFSRCGNFEGTATAKSLPFCGARQQNIQLTRGDFH